MLNETDELPALLRERACEALDNYYKVLGYGALQEFLAEMFLLQQMKRFERQYEREMTEFSAVEGLGGDDDNRIDPVAGADAVGRDIAGMCGAADFWRDEGRDQ
ncbi:MAG: hypothetical protein ACOYJ6_20720 [Caulobacterales bacterium]